MGRKRRASDERSGPMPGGVLSRIKGFFFGREVDEATAERLREIKGIALVAFALFLHVALLSYATPLEDPASRGWNWAGQVGWFFANLLLRGLGLSSLVLALLLLIWGAVLVGGKRVSLVSLRVFGSVTFVLSFAYLLDLCTGPNLPVQPNEAWTNIGAHLPYGPGGYLALASRAFFLAKFGGAGFFIVLLLLTLISFLLATEMGFYASLQGFRAWLGRRREERGQGFLAAVGGHLGSVMHALWNFVRGADLREGLQPAIEGAGGGVALEEPPAEGRRKAITRTNRPAVLDEDEDDEDEPEQDLLEDESDDEEDETEDDEDEVAYDGLEDRDDPTRPKRGEYDEDELEDDYEQEVADEEFEDLPDEPVPAPVAAKPAMQPRMAQTPVFDPPTPPPGPWKLPPIELLIRPESAGTMDENFIRDCAHKLEQTLKSFRIEANVVGAQVGPAVTLFELTVAQGTRMNKVTPLSPEIAGVLRAQSVRIIAPIPGRETIGIEVPNQKRRVVRISELIVARAYDQKQMALPLFLGMDAEGTPVVEDLARMPHLLIAGTTGSGKSVCINSILASLLLTRSPHDVKMILVDPKMVELQTFATVPHLMCPVVTDARTATQVLLWTIEKMEGRYELFKDAGVKNIKGYNALGEEGLKERLKENFDPERTPRHVPYIVVVVDEMADLMMTAKKEAELAITRLAQKSRAVGIHLILATQRPSTDVITGVIKGNLPTRIAFQVASRIDSRVILDEMGAEKLLGNGDMLFMPPGGMKLKRVQGALVEDSELNSLVEFVCKDSAPNFSQELIQVASGSRQPGESSGSMPDEDPLFDDAVRVILKTKRGSASLLQRALGVGYTRASRLIDIMTEHGIVGPHKGSKSRELLLTLDDWEKMHGVKEISAPRDAEDGDE
ncbi:MAG: DNA translocase FtsK 4TM domain-containing protein [Planctomycetes bacterium]|nr:DNA translocase FtsK 4TM domain-containing protein [Planctomycetota bacterium]